MVSIVSTSKFQIPKTHQHQHKVVVAIQERCFLRGAVDLIHYCTCRSVRTSGSIMYKIGVDQPIPPINRPDYSSSFLQRQMPKCLGHFRPVCAMWTVAEARSPFHPTCAKQSDWFKTLQPWNGDTANNFIGWKLTATIFTWTWTVNLKSQTCRKIGKHVGNQGAQHEHHELFHRRSHLAVGLPANSRIHPNFPVLHAMNYPKTHPNCHSKLVRFLVMTDLYTKIHHLATTCQFHHNHFRILLRSFCPFCQNLCLCLCLYFSYLSACPFL